MSYLNSEVKKHFVFLLNMLILLDGNKRKIDETGEDRAAKNPRGESPQQEIEQAEGYTSTQLQPDSPYSDHITEEEGPQHDLIILGLAYKVEEEELREYFEQFGEVETIEVIKANNECMLSADTCTLGEKR